MAERQKSTWDPWFWDYRQTSDRISNLLTIITIDCENFGDVVKFKLKIKIYTEALGYLWNLLQYRLLEIMYKIVKILPYTVSKKHFGWLIFSERYDSEFFRIMENFDIRTTVFNKLCQNATQIQEIYGKRNQWNRQWYWEVV